MHSRLIDRVLAGELAEEVISSLVEEDNIPANPKMLLVSLKTGVDQLHKALLKRGLRPKYKYANTSAKTQFYFPRDNADNLKIAYQLATGLGIKCSLI